jgi:DNA modification methylase
VIPNLRDCGFTVNQIIIWNKDHFALGHNDYQWKHEPCAYATKGNHNWKGGRSQSTVWDIKSINSLNEGAFGHSTQKPIECMKRPIENNSDKGDWVYDPFCGSGTTIIAAERSGRKCLAVELSPVYCDTIIRRWELETGKQAVRESDGKLFDDLDNAE